MRSTLASLEDDVVVFVVGRRMVRELRAEVDDYETLYNSVPPRGLGEDAGGSDPAPAND